MLSVALLKPGISTQDCYGAGAWGCDQMLRHPRSQMLMGLYYPHDVTRANGPTAILPQRCAYERVPELELWRVLGPCRPPCAKPSEGGVQ